MRRDQLFESGVEVWARAWPDTADGDVVEYDHGVEVSRRPVTADEWDQLTATRPVAALAAAVAAAVAAQTELRQLPDVAARNPQQARAATQAVEALVDVVIDALRLLAGE